MRFDIRKLFRGIRQRHLAKPQLPMPTPAQEDPEWDCGTAPGDNRIRWEMTYGDGRKKMIFEPELALAAFLMHEVVFTNSHHWEKTWPDAARNAICVLVNCNDVFAWGCADAEALPYAEIESVYDHWQKDPQWGPAIWCMIKRKQMPQGPVRESIEKAGIWNFDELRQTHTLRPNWYDGISHINSRMRYDLYAAWAKAENKPVRAYDVGWREGWKEYIDLHPDWCSEAFNAASDRAIEAWKAENNWDLKETTPIVPSD